MTELKEICKVQCGFAFDSKKFTEDDSFSPLIRIRDVKRGFTQTYYTGEFSSEYIVHKGDLLVGMDGEFNIARWNSEDALLNQRVCRIIANSNVNEDYLRFYLKRALKLIESKTSFVTVKHLSAKELNGLKLNLPCMEDQQRISKQLSILELVIRKNKKVLKLFDELVKARFVEMFGEIEDCDKWESKIWNEVVTIKNGRDYKKVLVSDGGYPVVGTGGEIARASKYLCPENTIVVGRKGSINNPMLMKEKFWNVDTAFGVIPNSDYLHYQYFYCFCKFYNFMKLNKATTLPSTTKADLLKIRINIPPLELQNQFASFVEEVDKSRSRIQKSLEASQELFDSLMQEYFG